MQSALQRLFLDLILYTTSNNSKPNILYQRVKQNTQTLTKHSKTLNTLSIAQTLRKLKKKMETGGGVERVASASSLSHLGRSQACGCQW